MRFMSYLYMYNSMIWLLHCLNAKYASYAACITYIFNKSTAYILNMRLLRICIYVTHIFIYLFKYLRLIYAKYAYLCMYKLYIWDKLLFTLIIC